MRKLATVNLGLAFVATTAPIAHVLEMASKFTLSGPLWLDIEQHLYRGWGPVFGPIEILALLSSLWLLLKSRTEPRAFRAFAIATACYALMLLAFFVFNAPANAALNGWTPATLPENWTAVRARWEIGHAISALLSVIAFVTLLKERFCECRNTMV